LGSDAGSEFFEAVRAAVAQTPFKVRKTKSGFVMEADFGKAAWDELTPADRLAAGFCYTVTVTGRRFTVSQATQHIDAGADGSARIVGHEREVTRTLIKTFGATADLSDGFISGGAGADSSGGLELIKSVGAELGLREAPPGAVLGAAIVGFGTLGLLVLGGIATLIAWIAGLIP